MREIWYLGDITNDSGDILYSKLFDFLKARMRAEAKGGGIKAFF